MRMTPVLCEFLAAQILKTDSKGVRDGKTHRKSQKQKVILIQPIQTTENINGKSPPGNF